MIELRGIEKELGGKPVLRGLDLKVEAGRTMVIVGPSGTGKSVTLQHILGLLKPDCGEVLVDGEDIQRVRGKRLDALREKFGVLFQSGALINWMTVFDNVALPLMEKTDMSYAEIRAAVQEQLDMLELRDVEDKMPSELSGGMRKRVGLARAIIRHPSIVLYDEPTSGLDPVLSRSIDRLIRDLQRRLQVTSVVVTHDLVSAFAVGDDIAMLHEGRIVATGAPDEFFQSRHPFVQEFIAAQFGRENRRAAGT